MATSSIADPKALVSADAADRPLSRVDAPNKTSLFQFLATAAKAHFSSLTAGSVIISRTSSLLENSTKIFSSLMEIFHSALI